MKTSHRLPTLAAATLTSALLLTSCGGNEDAADSAQTESEQADGAPEASPPAAEGSDGQTGESDDDPVFGTAELVDVAGNPVGTVTLAEADAEAEEAGLSGVRVAVEVQDLAPGFRGISIHENGLCEPQSANEWGQIGDFYSAGGHLEGEPEPEPEVIEGEEELEVPEEDNGDSPTPESRGETFRGVGPAGDVAPQPQPEPEPEPQPEPEADDQTGHPHRAGNLPNIMVNESGAGYLELITDRLDQELLLEDDGRAVILHSEPDHHGNIPQRYAPYGPDDESQVTGDTGARIACGVIGPAD